MIQSDNEWSPLKEVILGSSKRFNWSTDDPVFMDAYETMGWDFGGPVSHNVIGETEVALQYYKSILQRFDVVVHRPVEIDYVKLNAYGAYSPRDTVLIIGDKVIFTPCGWEKRRIEWDAYKHLFPNYTLCDDPTAHFDAANIIRCNRDIIYLVSHGGNIEGANWLKDFLGKEYNVHLIGSDVYPGHHLDTTIIPLREGLVLLNAARMTEEHVPSFMKSWDKIWIHPNDLFDFQDGMMGSRSIYLNVFSINEHVVVCDPDQTFLIEELRKHNIMCHQVKLPHCKFLAGGHHCTTLDMHRSN